jgi:hypothetical protein
MKTKNESTTDLCDLLQPLSDLSEYLGGKEIIPGILHALDAFAESEYQLKRYRKARMLKADGTDDLYNLAMAYNAVGIRRLNKGIDSWDMVVKSYVSYTESGIDRLARGQWAQIVEEEIIPDVKHRLFGNKMSAGELSIVTEQDDSLIDPNRWSEENILKEMKDVPQLLKSLLTERQSLRDADKNTVADVPDYGVSRTKKFIIKLVKILVKVAIQICKTWNKIISKIVDIVWQLTEKWVEEKVLERCRDGKPVPVLA